ncbi:MAG: DUF465 domain-containing protein [Candidatus Pacebacteria bacterium]|nr:DUF465 domain-containing protein [Candidatus Paceibacterota bacterium]
MAINDLLSAQELLKLQREHREVDGRLQFLLEQPACDQLEVQRLKKRKLALKDRITELHKLTLPNIIA